MKRPTTLAELACYQKRKPIHEALRRAVQSRTEKSSAPAAPAHAQSPLPSAGAAHNSGAWFLFDLGLTDEQARSIEESF